MNEENRRSFVKKSLATSMTFTFSGLIRAHGEEGGSTTVATTEETTVFNPDDTTFATTETTDSGGTTTWDPDGPTIETTVIEETTSNPEDTTVETTEDTTVATTLPPVYKATVTVTSPTAGPIATKRFVVGSTHYEIRFGWVFEEIGQGDPWNARNLKSYFRASLRSRTVEDEANQSSLYTGIVTPQGGISANATSKLRETSIVCDELTGELTEASAILEPLQDVGAQTPYKPKFTLADGKTYELSVIGVQIGESSFATLPDPLAQLLIIRDRAFTRFVNVDDDEDFPPLSEVNTDGVTVSEDYWTHPDSEAPIPKGAFALMTSFKYNPE
jgi:hypothetical protein